MVDKKLAKAQARIEELVAQGSQQAMSILNMRQMFEGVTQEKMVLQGQVQNLQNMLMGVVVQARGKHVTIKEKTFENIGKYAGIDTKLDDGDLVITALTVEQVEEMQADIDEEVSA